MKVEIELNINTEKEIDCPSVETMEKWASCALKTAGYAKDSQISVTMVDADEIRRLNRTYRQIDTPTNILSFPFEQPEGIPELPLLGDLIICVDVLKREAEEQKITIDEHFAHLIVHGCLHLLGYDHIEEQDQIVMEKYEIQTVEALGYENPYRNDYQN